MTKWYYQGIGGEPFLSRTAAREVRDITARSIQLCRRAIAIHGPAAGYVASLQTLESTYRHASEYLGQRDRR